MKNVIARELLTQSLDEVWTLNNERRVSLRLDDGEEHITSGRAVIFSWFVWEFHRRYPNVPITKDHVMPLKQFNKDSTLSFCDKVMWSVHGYLNGEVKTYTLCEIATGVINDIYNVCVSRMGRYISGVSALDYYEILKDEKIKEITKSAPASPEGLSNARKEIKTYLQDPNHYKGNNLKFICETGLVNWDQMLQVVAFRGDCTDVNSGFFSETIMAGYGHGITKLHQSLMESRGGAKSLMSNEDPIRKTEYFNRKMQIVCQYIQHLFDGDCGSTMHVEMLITKDTLKMFDGKYYLTADGSYDIVTRDSVHLIDTVVKMRSAIYCKRRSEYGTCKRCFGILSDSLPDLTNLGHWSATALCAVITQAILSTKHVDGAAAALPLIMTQVHRRYLKLEGNSLYLSRTAKGKKIELTIPENDVKYPEDLRILKSINHHTVSRMSEIKEIGITITDPMTGMRTHQPLEIMLGKSPVHLSAEMLNYLKYNGWSESDDGSFQIDMTTFDNTLPIITLPKIHRNMLEFMLSISEFIESKGDNKARHEKLSDYESPEDALQVFFNLVNEKVSVNIAHLEIFIMTYMVRSKADNDGRIPDITEPCEFVPTDALISLRSASAGMAYEKQATWFKSFTSFNGDKRPPHPFDGLIHPKLFNRN